MKILGKFKSVIRAVLRKIHCYAGSDGTGGYIDAHATEKAASRAGVDVGDYVEKLWNQKGGAERVVASILKNDFFFRGQDMTILEIGAGTGRYMGKVLDRLAGRVRRYESYETDNGWSDYLARAYPIVPHQTDGRSLAETADGSVDFIHAHGVFVYTPFITTMGYLNEVVRVATDCSLFAADFYTEDCMSDELLRKWLDSGHSYPTIMPEQYLLDFFVRRNFRQLEAFFNPHGAGRSKYFIFALQHPALG